MFPFDLPENIRKPKAFSCFQEDQKATLRKKKVKEQVVPEEGDKKNPHRKRVLVSFLLILNILYTVF